MKLPRSVVEQEVRVLDPLGDALARQHLADVVERDEGAQLVVADFGVDRHRRSSSALRRRRARLVRRARLA